MQVISNDNENQYYMDLEGSYGAANYLPIPVVLHKGEGCWVWDVDGKKYLDMMAAYSAISFGYRHPRILRTLIKQAETLAVTSRAYYTDQLGPFLKKACESTGMDKALPMNSGAEAVETAIKCARRWGHEIKGIPEDKAEIIVAKDNFHGRTTTIISFSSEAENKRGFGPLTPGFKQIPFNDTAALEAVITSDTAAFLIEPIQGEAGIFVPDDGYLKRCEEICRRNNVLLIVDEVQSGLGRSGKNYAIQHENVHPDGLILGKALGGGMLPVSLFLAKDSVMEVFNPGSHGSTFGGNPLACAVGLESLKVLEEENLAEKSARWGTYLIEAFRQIESPLIKRIRGRGLWIGIEIDPKYASARTVCERLALNNILSKETHQTVVRFAPPLIITKEQLDYGIEQFTKTLKELE